MIFVKRADTYITKPLKPNKKYLNFVTIKTREMARTGLRSLWFSYKTLPFDYKIDELSVDELEGVLTLLGATGIENRLQDFVP